MGILWFIYAVFEAARGDHSSLGSVPPVKQAAWKEGDIGAIGTGVH